MQYVILFMFFISFFFKSYSQKTSHLLSVSLSNNGQITPIIHDFYFSPDGYNPGDDTYSFLQSDPKFNLHYEITFPKNWELCGKFGFGFRDESYIISNVPNANGTEAQQYYHAALGARYVFELGKFQISTGGEIPFFYCSEYKANFTQNDPSSTVSGKVTTSAGYAIGLNNSTNLKFFIGKRFFIMTEISFGFLYFNLGGKYTSLTEWTTPPNPPNYYEVERSYKKFTITPPEFSFGFGVKIR